MSIQGASGNQPNTYNPSTFVAGSASGVGAANDRPTTFNEVDIDLDRVGRNPDKADPTREMPTPSPSEPSIVLSTDRALSELSVGHAEADSFAVMALMTSAIREQRSGARQIRGDELQSELKSRHAAVDKMREGISTRMWGGIISGGMTALGGAFSLGGAMKSAAKSGTTLKNSLDTKPVFDTKAVNTPSPLAKPSIDAKAAQQGVELTEMKSITQPQKTPVNTGATATGDLDKKPLTDKPLPLEKPLDPGTEKKLADLKEPDPRTAQLNPAAEKKIASVKEPESGTAPLDPAPEKSLEQRKIEAKELENWQKDLANQLHADGYSATKGEASSKLLSGSGSAIHAYQESSAAESDAKKAEQDAATKAHEIGYQQSSDVLHQTQDLLRDLREKLSAVLQSEVETTRAINRNI